MTEGAEFLETTLHNMESLTSLRISKIPEPSHCALCPDPVEGMIEVVNEPNERLFLLCGSHLVSVNETLKILGIIEDFE